MSNVMNIKTKLHQKIVVDTIKKMNWENGSEAPIVVEFDTTEACNLLCPGCISENVMQGKRAFSRKRLLELADEMVSSNVKAVILIGGGEPLAHPNVGEFIETLGRYGIEIGITTNGTFIDRYIDVIAKYASWTRVSMDAGTKEGFNKVRPSKSGINEFEHIVGNMKRLCEMKTGRAGYSFLIRTKKDGFGIESNVDELWKAALLAKEIGCDYFEVKPSYNFVGGANHSLVIHDRDDMEKAKCEIEKLEDLETDKFKIVKAINLEDSLRCVEKKQIKDYCTCMVSQLRTLITPSGVYICPYWRGKDEYKIGDVVEDSFKNMWNSERRKEVIKKCNPSTQCNFHCLRHESNIEIREILKTDIDKLNVLEEYDMFI